MYAPSDMRRFAVFGKLVGAWFAFWTAIGLFFSTQVYAFYGNMTPRTGHPPIPFTEAVRSSLTDWYVWGLLSLLIIPLARRYRVEHKVFARNVGIHIGLALLFAGAHLVLDCVCSAFVGMFPLQKIRVAIVHNFPLFYHWNVLVYFAIVALVQLFEQQRRAEERALRTSQLEAKLAQAQLSAIRSQLNPHFLFNTLNAISTLVHKDAAAADRMVVRLGDLLRFVTKASDEQQIPLQAELDLLRMYLDIQQIRFGDSLTVEVDVRPEAHAALVPPLILQPLVENAIVHGVAKRASGGRIRVLARRDGDRLRLVVEDNGPGLPAGGPAESRIGLGNTRARLSLLYGERQSFDLENSDEGGVRAEIALPFLEEARA